MRSMTKGLVLAAAGFAMFATPALAADSQNEMKEMRELVLKLQDQLNAQQEQIDEQQGVMREAGIEDERGSASYLSSFLESTDFSGWVAASYFYNFNNPKGNQSAANGPNSNPFHPDHNSFTFDEAWFVMDRGATEEMPAGFHFEITYGETASVNANGNPNGNDLWIPSANVSYLTPWGQTITAGKFGTTIGYEVAGAPLNVNITRGFTYNLFQPVSHTGVTVSQSFDGGMTYTLGVINGFGTEQRDTTQGKGVLWQVGWGSDTVTLLFNGMWEDNQAGGGARDKVILDAVLELTPNDNVLVWANADYNYDDISSSVDPWRVGLAVGTRIGITEDMGIGGRYEVAALENTPGIGDGWLHGWTLTTDYALTDNLTWKVEGKYEIGKNDWNSTYIEGRNGTENDAIFVGTQLYYEF